MLGIVTRIMHEAQNVDRIYTFIQIDVKLIDATPLVSYDLKNYLDPAAWINFISQHLYGLNSA